MSFFPKHKFYNQVTPYEISWSDWNMVGTHALIENLFVDGREGKKSNRELSLNQSKLGWDIYQVDFSRCIFVRYVRDKN